MKRQRTMQQAIKSFKLIFNSGTVINGDYMAALTWWRYECPYCHSLTWREYVLFWHENGAGRVVVEICNNDEEHTHITWLTFDHRVEIEEWFVRCLTKADRNWLSPWRKIGTIWDIFLRYGRVVKNGKLVANR